LLCPADLQMIADAGLVVEGHREQTLLAPGTISPRRARAG